MIAAPEGNRTNKLLASPNGHRGGVAIAPPARSFSSDHRVLHERFEQAALGEGGIADDVGIILPDPVGSTAAVELVSTGAADQRIVALAALEVVVAVAAPELDVEVQAA